MTTFDINNPALRQNPFRTPEGYFESLTDSVMKRIHGTTPIRRRTVIRELPIVRWLPLLGAACVAALALVFGSLTSLISSEATEATATSTNYEEAAYDYYSSTADADIFLTYDADY